VAPEWERCGVRLGFQNSPFRFDFTGALSQFFVFFFCFSGVIRTLGGVRVPFGGWGGGRGQYIKALVILFFSQ
jgi:hypothetical protein